VGRGKNVDSSTCIRVEISVKNDLRYWLVDIMFEISSYINFIQYITLYVTFRNYLA
jgi:hypothetical protein